jgi:3-deoxy-7-phosphoheptulonate synthase
MIVVMKTESNCGEIDAVIAHVEGLGLGAHLIEGEERTVVAVVGRTSPELMSMLAAHHGVSEVVPISKPYKLSSREVMAENTVVTVRGVEFGGGRPVIIAGPCSVEGEAMLIETARAVQAAGASVLRGGAYKPRTSPYQFRGLGEDGLRMLAAAREETGMPVVTEVLTVRDVELVARYADILQIGARNMQNYILLEEAGRSGKPVLLKRGLSGEIQEWLLCAEYILAQGNRQVILCERGIRTFEPMTRNTFDIAAIPLVKRLSHLPVIGDPSHGTGHWFLIEPAGAAALAAGADGLIIEVHPSPDHALSDGAQSLNFESFRRAMRTFGAVADAVGRPLHPAAAREPALASV